MVAVNRLLCNGSFQIGHGLDEHRKRRTTKKTKAPDFEKNRCRGGNASRHARNAKTQTQDDA